jgi:glycosyltransferase involved in cell wall biosynthesis
MAQSRSKRAQTLPSSRAKRSNSLQSVNKLVILIPAYNEATTIQKVIQAIPDSFEGIKKTQVLVIDDGSTDTTAKLAKQAGATVISHQANFGVGQALQTGLEAALQAQADYVVNIDADGQFSPKDIDKLLKPLISQRAEVVTGSRFLKPNWTPPMDASKYWGNRFMAWFLSQILHQTITDATCGFRAFTREAILRMQLFGRYTYTQEMFLQFRRQRLVFQERAIQVKPTLRPGGKSHVVSSLSHYIFQASIILLRSLRDYRPFHFFGLPGLVLAFLGTGSGVFTLFHYLQAGEITPYKSLGFIALFAWLGALLLFLVALIADMLDRIRSQQEKILYYLRQDRFNKP